jgi:hypothetical protein
MTKHRYYAGLCCIVFGSALVSATGCGGSTDSNKTGSVSNNEWASKIAVAYCEGMVDCCSASGFTEDVSTCKSTVSSVLTAALGELKNKKVEFNDAAAADCVDAYRNAAVSCTSRDAARSVNQVCKSAYVGTVALGGACSDSVECVPDPENDVTCDTGICTVQQSSSPFDDIHEKLGDNCTTTCQSSSDGSRTCAASSTQTTGACWTNDGLVCGSNGVCVTAPTIGQSCATGSFCADGSYCEGGVCIEQTKTGSCATSSDACASSSYCDDATQNCTPKKAAGAACDSDYECQGDNCYEDQCREWTMANAQSCAGLLD